MFLGDNGPAEDGEQEPQPGPEEGGGGWECTEYPHANPLVQQGGVPVLKRGTGSDAISRPADAAAGRDTAKSPPLPFEEQETGMTDSVSMDVVALMAVILLCGCSQSVDNGIQHEDQLSPPVLRIQTPRGLQGEAPFRLRFEARGTHDPDGGGIVCMSIAWGEEKLTGMSADPVDMQTWDWEHEIEEPGTYPLRITVWDDEGQEASWQDTCVVLATNQPPSALADEFFVCQRDGQALIVPTISDPDGDAVALEVIQEPSRGTLTSTATGDGWHYTAPANWAGWEVFRYRARDARGAASETVSAHVHVQAPPVCDVWSVEPSSGGLPSPVRVEPEGPVPLRVCLVLGESYDPDGGGFTRFAMVGEDWGVGMEAEGGTLNPVVTSLTHTFFEAGSYEVTVILVDDEGQQTLSSLMVEAFPVADG